MFLKMSTVKTGKLFGNEGGAQSVMCNQNKKKIGELLGAQYLFEILPALITVKKNENVLKGGSF